MVQFAGQDNLSGMLGKVATSFEKSKVASANMAAKVMSGAKIVAAGVAMMAASIKALSVMHDMTQVAEDFEQAITNVGALANVTGKEFDRLSIIARKAGRTTQFTAVQSANAMSELVTGGLNAAQAGEALIPVLDMAAASLGKLEPPEAGAAIIQTMNQFGLQAKDTGMIVDKLTVTATNSALAFNEIKDAMTFAGRTARASNQDLSGVLTSLGLIRKTAGSASVAGSNFNTALLNLTANAKNAKLIQQKYGISLTDSMGKLRPFANIVFDLEKKLSGMTNQQKRNAVVAKIFGKKGIGAYTALVGAQAEVVRNGTKVIITGAEAYAHMKAKIDGASGATAKLREKLLSTFKGQKTLMKSAFEGLMLEVGKPFVAAFKPMVKIMTKVVNTITSLILKIPVPIKKAIAWVAIITAAIIGVVGAVLAVGGAIKIGAVLFAVFGAAIGAAVILAIKIIVVIAAIIAAVYLLYKVWKWVWSNNIAGIRDFVMMFVNLFARIKLFWKGITQLFSQGGFSGSVMKELNKASNAGLKKFIINVFAFFHRLSAFWTGVKAGFGTIVEAFAPVWEAFKTVFVPIGFLIDTIKQQFEGLGQIFSYVFGTLFESSTNNASSSWMKFGKIVGFVMKTALKPLVWLLQATAYAFTAIVTVASLLVSTLIKVFSYVSKIKAVAGIVTYIGGLFGGKKSPAKPATTTAATTAPTTPGVAAPAIAAPTMRARSGAGATAPQVNVITPPGQPQIITSNVILDGNVLATTTNEINKDEQQRGFKRL
jgi:TP901 family phage tail tape measure protein